MAPFIIYVVTRRRTSTYLSPILKEEALTRNRGSSNMLADTR